MHVAATDLHFPNGCVVTPVDGDQPSLLLGLVTWAQRIGFTVLAAGKASEYDFVVDLGRDVAMKVLRSRLYDAGTRDPLTNVYNRRYFDQHLDGDFRLALRHREELSLLMIDVDRFKGFNDTCGHPAGDVASRVLSGLKTTFSTGAVCPARGKLSNSRPVAASHSLAVLPELPVTVTIRRPSPENAAY